VLALSDPGRQSYFATTRGRPQASHEKADQKSHKKTHETKASKKADKEKTHQKAHQKAYETNPRIESPK
jgi:hypothetical protein